MLISFNRSRHLYLLYFLLGSTSALYAGFLNTPTGLRFVKRRTAESVILGTGIVLAFLLVLIPLKSWLRVTAAFGVASVPIVARSLVIRSRGEYEI